LSIAFSQINSGQYVSLVSNNEYIIKKMYLDGHSSPIGWSRSGYIAYARVLHGVPNHCQIFVMNTITDEYVDSYTNVIYEETPWSDTEWSNLTFKEFWSENKIEITIFLKKYNIMSFPDIELQSMATLKQQYGLEVILDNPNSGSTTMIVKNNNGKMKIVHTEHYLKQIKILGFYKSPYEDRMVLYYEGIGMTGPSGQTEKYYDFVGCHLTVGF
jgi:hypothetical protein